MSIITPTELNWFTMRLKPKTSYDLLVEELEKVDIGDEDLIAKWLYGYNGNFLGMGEPGNTETYREACRTFIKQVLFEAMGVDYDNDELIERIWRKVNDIAQGLGRERLDLDHIVV